MKRILLILTGGTIAMQFEKTGTSYLNPSMAEKEIIEKVHDLDDVAQIDTTTLFLEDSSNINPSHWVKLASCIEENYNSYDGFVIIHGTDTMAYSATALSYSLKNLNKPVILTGSQIPLANKRSDAPRNLINAIEVATLPVNEVAICFNDKVFRGNRSTKLSIDDYDAFESPNFNPLAEIGIEIETRFKPQIANGKFYAEPKFDSNVFILTLFPGFNVSNFLDCFDVKKYKGVIIEAFGSGNIPVNSDYSVLPLIEKAQEHDCTVVIRSQAMYDSVNLTMYENGKLAELKGALSSGDMTLEAALIKMMYLHGIYEHTSIVNQRFLIPIAGEVSI